MTRSLSSQLSLFNVGSGGRDHAAPCVFSGQVNGPFLAELNDEVLLQIMSPGEFGKKTEKRKFFLHQKKCLIGVRYFFRGEKSVGMYLHEYIQTFNFWYNSSEKNMNMYTLYTQNGLSFAHWQEDVNLCPWVYVAWGAVMETWLEYF